MTEVVWTPQAVEDVEAIRRYVTRDSERYATLLVAQILAAVDRLTEYPLSGRVVPELGDSSIREVLCRSYRVVHRVAPDRIEILTVFHGARLLRFE